MKPNIHYRIYVMNDFKDKHAFIEYHSYGQGHLQIFNCSITSGVHRGFPLPEDHIFVFLNYKQLGKFKIKEDARRLVSELINDCPKETSSDFIKYGNELLSILE